MQNILFLFLQLLHNCVINVKAFSHNLKKKQIEVGFQWMQQNLQAFWEWKAKFLLNYWKFILLPPQNAKIAMQIWNQRVETSRVFSIFHRFLTCIISNGLEHVCSCPNQFNLHTIQIISSCDFIVHLMVTKQQCPRSKCLKASIANHHNELR